MRLIKSGCYVIRNVLDNNIYVGSSKDLVDRKNEHWYRLRRGNHHSPYLQRSWNKYSEVNFVWEVIEYAEVAYDPARGKHDKAYNAEYREMLVTREQYFMDMLKPAFNNDPNARSRLGARHSPETIAKLKSLRLSDEHKAKISMGRTGIGLGAPRPGSMAGIHGIEWNQNRQRWLVRYEDHSRGQFFELKDAIAHLAKVKLDPSTPNPPDDRSGVVKSEEEIAKLRERMMGNTYGLGQIKSDEARALSSAKQKGVPRPYAAVPCSAEKAAKIKATQTGVPRPWQHGKPSKPSKSGHFGIGWRTDSQKWMVRINNKKYGSFDTLEEAIARRDEILKGEK